MTIPITAAYLHVHLLFQESNICQGTWYMVLMGIMLFPLEENTTKVWLQVERPAVSHFVPQGLIVNSMACGTHQQVT